jgi:PAS domain S-box-containing protein
MADITKIDTFIQSSPHPAWLATTQGHCVYANPALERLTGFNSDQINQADWRSFLLEEDRAVASASWQRSLATGTPYRAQVRMRVSDGAPECVELIAFGHKAGDGPELWLFSALDANGVAAQKRPELEAQIQATLNVIPAYAWYALPSGALTFVNERTANYLGLPKDHALRFGIDTGAEWDSHTALLRPDDREEARRVWSTCLSTGTAGEFTFRVPSAQGKYRWFLTRAEPLRANDGTLLYWIGVSLDIDDAKRAEDALRKSEKELRDAIDTIPALVWSARPDGSNTYVNKRFVEYTGLSAEQTAGPGWQALIHPDDLERHAVKWAEAVATGKPHENEVRSRRSDGQYRWQLDRGVPLRDEDGNIVKWYGVTTDIEDRKRAEQRLRESEAYLAEAQRLSQTGSWAWNPATGDIRYWSEMCYRVLGFDPAGPLPRFEEFSHRVHPDDQAAMRERFEKAIRDKADFELDYRVVHPEKGIRDIHVVGHAVLDGSGNLGEFVGTVIDVTEPKRAEEALQLVSSDLQDSKAKLEEAQRITHVGYWEWDLATNRIKWSAETYRIYGMRPQECPMDIATVQEKIHPEDWQRGMAEAHGGGHFNAECRVFRPTGEVRIAHFQGEVKRDASGQPYYMFGTVQDITDRKRAEEELRRSQFYLSEGQRLAHTGSWALNPSGSFEYWSQELFKIYGLHPQKGAPTLQEYLAAVHPQDRDFMANTIKRMIAERGGCDVKKRIVRPDGEQRYIRYVGIPVVEDDLLKGFLGTAMDVTEQELLTRELERQQAHLTEAQKLTHTGSWAWRIPDRNAMEISEEFYRIYGFDPAEGAPTLAEFLERVHPEDRLKWKGITEWAIMEKADYDHEYRLLLPNGKVKWIHTVGHPVLSNTGDLEQFVGSSTDITALKSAEQERERLRQLEADLAHTNRVSTLGEMAASLAHEIKQPIAAAITSANSCMEWLAHEPPNLDRARAAAARIDKYGNRAAEIIDRIRSLYKKSPPHRELVDMNGIIQEMFTLLKGEANRYSVATRTELAADLPKIVVDRVQLQQVFMNLMLNGIEAMKDSGGELRVLSQLQDSQLLFSVSDTGVGLPMEKMDQIFSAFFTTKPQGSGMGLAISRSIVESHGGQLWASANSRGGATFHFTLPIQVTESSPLVA